MSRNQPINALDAEPPIASFLKSKLIGGPVNAVVRMKKMTTTEPVEIIRLPEWAAGSHRALVTHAVFIPGFPLYRSPREAATPFAKELDGWHFVYMTNRTRRYTYLFKEEPTPKEIRKFPIEIGYTGLWVLRKTTFFRGPGDKTLLFRDRIAKPPEGKRISAGDFVVLQDPFLKTTNHDVVFAGTKADSVEFAQQAVSMFRCSLLVAELIHDAYWH